MKKVKIAYDKLTAPEIISRALNVHTKLTGNDTFPALPVTLAALLAQINIVKEAETAAANRDREMLAALRNEKKVLAGMLRQLAEYVNTTVTDGDEDKLLSSGFVLYKTPENSRLPLPIQKIDASFTNIPQTIKLEWSRSKYARYYNVFMSADAGETWVMLGSEFGRKLLVDALQSGTRYMFKVIPVGIKGLGPVSDTASQLAS